MHDIFSFRDKLIDAYRSFSTSFSSPAVEAWDREATN